MKVSIVGTGYVGLVSGVCLAEKGHQVICVDVDAEKIEQIHLGHPPFHEKGLTELLEKNRHAKFRVSTDLYQAVADTDISLIAVGTPYRDSEIDLTYIREVSLQIGQALKAKQAYHAVVVKSTVVPGTTDSVVRPILEEASGKKAGPDFGLGMNPEFLREGEAVGDFMSPDRIVLGALDAKSLEYMDELYHIFPNAYKIRTSTKTAEMIKYTSNALLATLISFSNEIANVCSGVGGVDVVDVMKGLHLDNRISPTLPDGNRIFPGITSYLEAGCGFGGSCFPKDVNALIAHGSKYGSPMNLLAAVMQVNREQPKQMMIRLRKHFPSLSKARVAVLGLAFKPGTDDMRESPAIPLIRELLAEKARINAYDPVAGPAARMLFGNHQIRYMDKLSRAIENVEAILLVTRWPEFSEIPELLKSMNPQPLVVDGRRMLSKDDIARYEGIGL